MTPIAVAAFTGLLVLSAAVGVLRFAKFLLDHSARVRAGCDFLLGGPTDADCH